MTNVASHPRSPEYVGTWHGQAPLGTSVRALVIEREGGEKKGSIFPPSPRASKRPSAGRSSPTYYIDGNFAPGAPTVDACSGAGGRAPERATGRAR
jgi:hypothetical protein